MTLNERIQHVLLLTSFITLVVTGFALKFPESLWIGWFISLLGENAFELRGDIHRGAAIVMVAVSVYHVGYLIFTERGKKLVKDIWIKKQDAADLKQSFQYFIGRVTEKPKFSRFSYIEKAEYWAVIWGTVVMGVTGSILWFENLFLPIVSNTGMDIATAIHYYEAILATLAIIVWHFYFVIYNPDVYPMNKAWLTGHLSEEEMEKEHPLELEEIKAKERKTKKANEMIDSQVELKSAENEPDKNNISKQVYTENNSENEDLKKDVNPDTQETESSPQTSSAEKEQSAENSESIND